MAEIEIELSRTAQDAVYAVVVRGINADSQSITEPRRGVATFDLAALQRSGDAYGRVLLAQLFADPGVLAAWAAVLDAHAAAPRGEILRIRLMIDRGAPELHRIEWEKLARTADGPALLLDETVVFSRFLFASGREPELRIRGALRALLLIANPSRLSDGTWKADGDLAFAPMKVDEEEARARAAMGGMPVTVIKSQPGQVASLENLIEELGNGYDVLYLICHGAGEDDLADARVFLEDHHEAGNVKVVRATDLAARIASLQRRPTVAVLASCESAGVIGPGRSAAAPLAALGPKLMESGVLAVVAMQGRVAMETAQRFGAALFTHLVTHGNIDQAVAVARNGCEGQPDWWMPVLFSRLLRGAIWYTQGFSDDGLWPDLIAAIQAGQLTPLIGPGLMTPILGSPEVIAEEFAAGFLSRAPQANFGDLPRVAQVRSKINSRDVVHNDLEALVRRRAAQYLGIDATGKKAVELLAEAWKREAEKNPNEPHAFLASLPLKVYITANIDDSLALALRRTPVSPGSTVFKDPTVGVFRWNLRMGRDEFGERISPARSTRATSDQPTVECPLVFHLFGHISDRESLVVSEDDFFDYLMASRLQNTDLPTAVEWVWRKFPLIFLGFHVDDWRFRVMFRSILNEHRRDLETKYKSVAASVVPEESGVVPMRRYLEKYFGGSQIQTYWGPVTAFLRDLAEHWRAG